MRLPFLFIFTGIFGFVLFHASTLASAADWLSGHPRVPAGWFHAVGYLALTGLSGMAMGLNFPFNIWPALHERLFGAHIWLGAVGWFGLLITGFSYKMLPMFYLAHNVPTRLQYATLGLWNAGVVAGASSFLLGGGFWPIWISLLLIAAAIVTYNVNIMQIYKRRHKKHPGAGIVWSVYSCRALAVAAMVMLIYLLWRPEQLLAIKPPN